ncbi:dolichol kinase [Folsomia candida]|nr:dolichol kinase [Folsomia candida]
MFTALNSDDSVQGEDTTPNYLFERNNENNRGGPRRANGYSVSENLKMEPEFFFRTKNPGYWTLILLPLAIYFADQKFLEQSLPAVTIIGYNSLVLIFSHNLGQQRMREFLEYLKGLNLIMALLSIGYGSFLHWHTNKNNVYEYALWAGLNFSFPYVFINVVLYYPFSFSFGEGVIVTSVFVYNYWASFHNIIQNKFAEINKKAVSDPMMISIVQELGFLVTILVARGILFYMKPHKVFALQECFTLCTKAAFVNFLGKLQNTYEDLVFILNWLVSYLILDTRHLASIALWVTFLAVTMGFVLSTMGQETTTVHRKFFHILMCFVYFPAVLNDLNFIFLCSTVVMYAFVIAEAIRVLKFEFLGYRVGAFINSGVSNFRDARDSGPLLLTPIYLLAGCSAPIWLTGIYLGNSSSNNDNRTPEELAAAITGILSVGVGDTVASVVGSIYGKLHWPGSRKTVEGTLSSIAAQIVTVGYLCWSGYLPYTTVSLVALCISSIVNAVVEALTSQIDNLIVPLVAFNTVHLVIYLSDYIS